jgi:hypothetical protein
MYKVNDLVKAARKHKLSLQVQGDSAVIYGGHPGRITHSMASEGFSFAGHEVDIHSLTGQKCVGIIYPIKD